MMLLSALGPMTMTATRQSVLPGLALFALIFCLLPAFGHAEPPIPPLAPGSAGQGGLLIEAGKPPIPPASKPRLVVPDRIVTPGQPPLPPPEKAQPVALPLPVPGHKPKVPQAGAAAVPDGFAIWLADFRADMAGEGRFSEAFLGSALSNVRFLPRVIALDRRQPEHTVTIRDYLARVISDHRVAQGRRRFRDNRTVLQAVEQHYGVPAEVVTALWGIETSYGQITGGFRVLDALATLAYEGRRRAFFRAELVNLLTIMQQEGRTADQMLGSWAGAMGQSQFMPSSFLSYAVDHDGDGHRDIWGTEADVFASAANFLARSGWHRGERIGREVRLPRDLSGLPDDEQQRLSLAAWQQRGLRLIDGADLPVAGDDFTARLVVIDAGRRVGYLAYRNFDVIMRWNRSNYFATAVGLLSARIGAAR